MRPANMVTAVADVLAGAAVSGLVLYDEGCSGMDLYKDHIIQLFLLCCSTACLYAGGIVFNDVFDAALDSVERPERMIPRGIITETAASVFGVLLFGAGICSAFFASAFSGYIAVIIVLLALSYDKWSKHHLFFGPLNMGACRAFNLALGMSLVSGYAISHWYLCIAPLVYIFAITFISRGEVLGGTKLSLKIAGFLYFFSGAVIVAYHAAHHGPEFNMFFYFAWIFMVMMPLFKAMKEPSGPMIGKAVKAGVLGLILMDATWAAVSGNYLLAGIIVCLLPLSLALARIFAVT
jgi:4-hydroxybenzoate polyprenyltransferase